MAEFLAKIGDGHRHRYDKPPYQRDPGVIYVFKRVPPKERLCIHCGVDEKEVQRYKGKQQIPILNALAAAEKAAARLHKRDAGGLNNFAIIHGKIQYKTKYYWMQPCYGSLNYESPGNHKYFVDRAGYNPRALKYLEYQEWCMTGSPYATAFVNDHAHYVKTQCTIQDCTKMTASYIVGAAMQFRYLYEHEEILKSWTSLVKLGVDPAIAFIAASWGQMSGTWYRNNTYGVNAGHTIFNNTLGPMGLQNYLDHNPQTSVEMEEYAGYQVEGKIIIKSLEKAVKSMKYTGLMMAWQPKPQKQGLIMPGKDLMETVDSLRRKQTRKGFDFSTRTVEEFHDEFIKGNGVIYEPKESIYRERRSSLCTDVSQCRVEGSET
jgi:hypothetical protein